MTDLLETGNSVRPAATARTALRRLIARPGLAAPEAAAAAGRIIQLDGRFATGGVWAGVGRLVELAYLDLVELGRDDILEAHDYELYRVLPAYRDRIRPRYQCLTDTAVEHERTRFYALDHAHQLIHGLVRLILDWKQALPERDRWTIILRNYDEAQHLTRRCFAELARRAAPAGEIEIVIETSGDGTDAELAAQEVEAVPTSRWTAELQPDGAAPPALTEPEIAALEARLAAGDEVALELNYPALLAEYRRRGDALRAAGIALQLLKIYNRDAYYFESKSFLELILPCFDALIGSDQRARIGALTEFNKCLVTTGDAARVPDLVERLAAPYLTQPVPVATMNYILSMHHLRYADRVDLALAERHILHAVETVRAAADDPAIRDNPFIKVFIDNGLALIRVRQGRHQDALDLCRSGYERLTGHVGEGRHLLHRSVLIYNVGQVYAMLGHLDDALGFYAVAMKMDPYFPHYYNDCGNLLLKLDRHREAVEHYKLGEKYGSPDPVLYFNEAICHIQLEEWDEALRCFATSLGMQPNQPEIHAMRGELLAGLERGDEALADYDAALARAPNTVAARVNRAVLHYGNGDYERALADMDRVIALDPAEPGHYENRAAIYQALGRDEAYQRDVAAAARLQEAAA